MASEETWTIIGKHGSYTAPFPGFPVFTLLYIENVRYPSLRCDFCNKGIPDIPRKHFMTRFGLGDEYGSELKKVVYCRYDCTGFVCISSKFTRVQIMFPEEKQAVR